MQAWASDVEPASVLEPGTGGWGTRHSELYALHDDRSGAQVAETSRGEMGRVNRPARAGAD